jgi:hypothetical protein
VHLVQIVTWVPWTRNISKGYSTGPQENRNNSTDGASN